MTGDAMVERDLWTGADVRWCGPETVRGGVRLRPGDPAVVVDAGRYQLSSIGALYAADRRSPRPRRGVVIETADGSQVQVPRKHLELVAPDHPLSPEPDGAHAAWWLEQLDTWDRDLLPVSAFVPRSLEAVCQVDHPGVEGQLDPHIASALLDVLADATTTPDEMFVAVWVGWGDVPPERFPGAARIDTPGHEHFLLRGPVRGALTSVAVSGFDQPAAGLWWPADHAWFVATDIDFEWTFVAGAQALIDRLVDDQRLEVAPTSFDAPANRAADRH